MRKPVFICSLFAITLALAPACATKGFVRTEVGQVNDKVTTLGASLEDTQERVRQNEGRIAEVDERAQQAAGEARQEAVAAHETANTANLRADAIEEASRKLIYEVVLNEDQGGFRFGRADLPEEAQSAIDQMVSTLQNQRSAVWLEIEGHTDSVGNARYNDQLGLSRAEAVKRYLYERHQVPLHKMNVISYGQERPVAPNTSRDGRAQNRRVVIRVLS